AAARARAGWLRIPRGHRPSGTPALDEGGGGRGRVVGRDLVVVEEGREILVVRDGAEGDERHAARLRLARGRGRLLVVGGELSAGLRGDGRGGHPGGDVTSEHRIGVVLAGERPALEGIVALPRAADEDRGLAGQAGDRPRWNGWHGP